MHFDTTQLAGQWYLIYRQRINWTHPVEITEHPLKSGTRAEAIAEGSLKWQGLLAQAERVLNNRMRRPRGLHPIHSPLLFGVVDPRPSVIFKSTSIPIPYD